MGTMPRSSMLIRLGLLAGLAVVAVLVAVVMASPGKNDSQKAGSPAAAVSALKGIPQSGVTLGSPDAPVTMVEFADLQCPFCAEYSRDVLPTLIDRYVRTGKVQLQLRLLRFLGPDSDRLARVAVAAAAQDRMWQFVELAYQRQGSPRVKRAIAGLALLGLAISAYLTWVHYAGIEPVCTGISDCERVQSSEYAELVGVPVALIGVVGYATILASLRMRVEATALLSYLAVVFSAYLTWTELFQIDEICQWCVVSALASLA